VWKIRCDLPANGRSISLDNLIVGATDEAQSTVALSRTVRKILHIPRELVKGAFGVVDVVVPSSEHLSIGEVRFRNVFPILLVDSGARRVWEVVFECLELFASTRGQFLHHSEGRDDLFALLFVGTRFVPVKVPVIGFARTDTREDSGSLCFRPRSHLGMDPPCPGS
jgi:hypothetical protein